MKRGLTISLAALCAALALAEPGAPEEAPRVDQPVRNPFWPIGYEGERAQISADSVVERPAPAVEEPGLPADGEGGGFEAPGDVVTARDWAAARQSLKVGSRLSAKEADGSVRSSVVVNGYPYTDGDLLSVTHDGRRFTWRVGGLDAGGAFRLVRVRAKIGDQEEGK